MSDEPKEEYVVRVQREYVKENGDRVIELTNTQDAADRIYFGVRQLMHPEVGPLNVKFPFPEGEGNPDGPHTAFVFFDDVFAKFMREQEERNRERITNATGRSPGGIVLPGGQGEEQPVRLPHGRRKRR